LKLAASAPIGLTLSNMKPVTTVALGPRYPHATVSKALCCLVQAGGTNQYLLASELAKSHVPALRVLPEIFERAAVGAQPLGANDPFGFSNEVFTSLLVDDLRTLLDRFTRIPQRTKVPVENSAGGNAGWISQGLPLPIVKSTTSVMTLDVFQLGSLSVLSRELFRFGVKSEQTFMRILRDQVSRFLASALFDPTKSAATANPASLTNIAGHLTSTGSTAAQITSDLNTLVSLIGTAMVSPFWIMRPKTFYRISATLGGAGLNVSKNDLFGIPVITLSGLPQEIVLLDAASVFYVSDDQAELSVSTDSSLEMSDSPSSSGITGTGASLVSLWQTGEVGVQATLYMNWANAFMLNSSPNVPSGISYMTVTY
jgi:hypothetical protein